MAEEMAVRGEVFFGGGGEALVVAEDVGRAVFPMLAVVECGVPLVGLVDMRPSF